MKKVFILITVAVVATLGFIFLKNREKPTVTSEKKVVATIFPVYDIVKNIAGDKVKVELLLPPGASPHTYDPSPNDLKKLQNSDTIFVISHGLDDWAIKLAQSAGVANNTVVDKYVKLYNFEKDTHEEETHTDEEEEHEHEGIDPHYFTSGKNGIQIAKAAKEELSNLYPEYKDYFEENFKTYEEKLNKTNKEIEDMFAKKDNKEIATFHNAWSYFARDYGLNIVTTFEEFPGETPSPEYLKEFSEEIQEYNVKVIFSEPQFSTNALEPLAKDLDVKISSIDPLGGTDYAPTYIDLLIYNGERIGENL